MLPLKEKTILITRSADQAEDLMNKLQELGASTIALPLIENSAVNQNDLTKKINNNNYDWVIFTSVNAVKFFFETISSSPSSSKYAVVGSKTKKALEKISNVDFIPSEYTAKHLANEIPIKDNERILIPRSNLAKNDIIEILENRNSLVEVISIYENKAIKYSTSELNKIINQPIDFITFTSGSMVQSFIELGIKLSQEKVICIGPETAKIAKQNNIKVKAIANPHTIEGMISSIIEAIN